MIKALQNNLIINARAPGKIILSGEHAVVYQKPALAMAINRFADASISEVSFDNKIYFEFLSSKIGYMVTLEELRSLKKLIDGRYQRFIDGKCGIKEVITSPQELVQYAFIYLADQLSLPIKTGLKINVQTNFPFGCGMGASAAVIVSIMHALAGYFNYPLSQDEYIYFGKKIEDLQHGKSSGLDLFLSFLGGCFFINNGTITRKVFNFPFILVDTKRPQTTTGECVELVSKYFKDSNLANSFAEVTIAINNALQRNDSCEFKHYINENHNLLKYIGVVPVKVEGFIEEVKKRGNVAKISGAGAVAGDNGGVVVVIGDNDISDIVDKYGYEILKIQGEDSGVKII